MKNRSIYVSSPNPKFNDNREFVGDCGFIIIGAPQLEQFIVNQLFPIGSVPTGVISYLQQKNLRTIKYISNYIFSNISTSKESPTQISKLKNAIKEALLKENIDINELRTFDENDVINWTNAKTNGKLGPFGSIKRR